jgi:hypothetical protein
LQGAWGDEYTSFNTNLVRGLGSFLRTFPEADSKRLASNLAKSAGGASGLLGKGRTMREVNGGSVAAGVAEVILALYNRNLRNKLGE